MRSIKASSVALLNSVTATGAGEGHSPYEIHKTFQAVGSTSSGSGAADIDVEVSDIDSPSSDEDWMAIGTISLTLSTTQATDVIATKGTWKWVRGNVTAISGTGATVTLMLGNIAGG